MFCSADCRMRWVDALRLRAPFAAEFELRLLLDHSQSLLFRKATTSELVPIRTSSKDQARSLEDLYVRLMKRSFSDSNPEIVRDLRQKSRVTEQHTVVATRPQDTTTMVHSSDRANTLHINMHVVRASWSPHPSRFSFCVLTSRY